MIRDYNYTMRKLNPFRDKDKKEQVIELYRTGLNLRQIGELVNRSHEWVRSVIKDYPQEELLTSDDLSTGKEKSNML